MMKQSIIHGFLVGVTLTVGYLPLALADIAPPDGYVEQCTVEKKQASGQTCVSCQNDYRSFATDAGDPCQQQYGSQGYTKICQSYGASVWSEVWCTGAGATDAGAIVTDAGTGPTTPTAGCNCRTTASHVGGPAAVLLVLGALASTRLLKRHTRA